MASDKYQDVGPDELGGFVNASNGTYNAADAQSPHVINMGKLVEEHENKIRNTLNEIYFGKSKDIVNGLRSITPLKDESAKRALAKELNKRLAEKPSWSKTDF